MKTPDVDIWTHDSYVVIEFPWWASALAVVASLMALSGLLVILWRIAAGRWPWR